MTGASSSVQLTPYRFTSAIGAAQNLCNILIELGSALLSVLEKNDAEALAALRNNQEGQILEMNISIKTERISEIQANILSLTASQTGAASRLTYYTDMLNNGLSGYEQTSLDATAAALAANILGSISKTAATIAYAVPQVGSPFAMTYGGVQLGSAVNASSGVFEIGAEISSFISQRAATMGGTNAAARSGVCRNKSRRRTVTALPSNLLPRICNYSRRSKIWRCSRKALRRTRLLSAICRINSLTRISTSGWQAA
jgi:hypothetical protein